MKVQLNNLSYQVRIDEGDMILSVIDHDLEIPEGGKEFDKEMDSIYWYGDGDSEIRPCEVMSYASFYSEYAQKYIQSFVFWRKERAMKINHQLN